MSATPLLNLPLDIISIIVGELERQRSAASLYRLASTCRAFFGLAAHLIPKHISFPIPSPQAQRFIRALERNPTLGEKVQTFTLLNDGQHYTDEDTDRLRKDFLWYLPNLRTFQADDPAMVLPYQFMYTFWDQRLPLRQTLQEVSFGKLGIGEIMILLSFPKLVRLSAEAITGDLLLDNVAPKCAIQHLDLGDGACPLDRLRHVLSSTPSLRSLWTNVPHTATSTLTPTDNRRTAPSMLDLSQTLQQVANTLTNLDLHTGSHRLIDYTYNGSSRLHLRQMSVLKRLSASATLLLAPSVCDLSRDELASHLPPSLEHLCLSFCYNTPIFYQCSVQSNPNAGPRFLGSIDRVNRNRFLQHKITESDASWILQLAQSSTVLPCLREVVLYEVTWWHHALLKSERWVPPISITQTFKDALIELDVFVRAPADVKERDGIKWN